MADKIRSFAAWGAWLVLGILLYAKTFHAPFLFDDEALIVHNPLVQDLSHGFDSFKNIYSYQHSRLLTNVTIAFNFRWGGLDTFGYHVVNMLLHILVTFGVWRFTRMVMSVKNISSPVDAAFWTSLVFFVHPLHTESVSYINHRSSLLVTLFYLWSLIFYLQARTAQDRDRSRKNFIQAGLFALLAVLSKESAWTLPLAWVGADMILLGRKPGKPVWLSLAVVAGAMLLLFEFKFKETLLAGLYSQSHRGDYLTLGSYLLTQMKVCLVFVRLMIVPVGLNADYDFPMSHSILEPSTAAAFVFWVVVCAVAYAWRHRCWFFAWCVTLFIVSLLSHFVPVRYNVIAEHKTYLTLALLMPVLGVWMLTFLKERFMIVMAGIIAVFAVLTIARNEVWASPLALWQDTVSKSPQKPRPLLNLASALMRQGKTPQAEAIFLQLAQIAPEYCETYINLAQIETDRGNLEKALSYSNRAIAVNPGFDVANLQNAFLHDRMGHRSEALKSFKIWLSLHPNDAFVSNRIQSLQRQDN